MIQAHVLKQVQWPILLVGFWIARDDGIRVCVMSVLRFQRIANSTQSNVVLCDYSLTRVIYSGLLLGGSHDCCVAAVAAVTAGLE